MGINFLQKAKVSGLRKLFPIFALYVCYNKFLKIKKKKLSINVRLACDGIWALVELGPLLCIPIPFSVRNSSRSIY